MNNLDFWIMVWVISAIISGVIGNRKGKPVAGALAGIMFGPVGVIVALISGDKQRKPCPECAELIMKKAKVCQYCKAKI